MTRKGQMEMPAMIPLFLSVAILIVLLFVMLFIVSVIRGCDPKPVGSLDQGIQSNLKKIDAQQILLTFLNTPIVFEDKDVLMGEFIAFVVDSCEKENDNCQANKQEFITKSEGILSYLTSEKPWTLLIYNEKLSSNSVPFFRFGSQVYDDEWLNLLLAISGITALPNKDPASKVGRELINVRLIVYRK